MAALEYLLTLTPGKIWLVENAQRTSWLLQDHEFFIRDRNRPKDNNNTAGRVPKALNDKPTTWADLGIDPTKDPLWPLRYNEVVVKGMQGLDTQAAIARAAGIRR